MEIKSYDLNSIIENIVESIKKVEPNANVNPGYPLYDLVILPLAQHISEERVYIDKIYNIYNLLPLFNENGELIDSSYEDLLKNHFFLENTNQIETSELIYIYLSDKTNLKIQGGYIEYNNYKLYIKPIYIDLEDIKYDYKGYYITVEGVFEDIGSIPQTAEWDFTNLNYNIENGKILYIENKHIINLPVNGKLTYDLLKNSVSARSFDNVRGIKYNLQTNSIFSPAELKKSYITKYNDKVNLDTYSTVYYHNDKYVKFKKPGINRLYLEYNDVEQNIIFINEDNVINRFRKVNFTEYNELLTSNVYISKVKTSSDLINIYIIDDISAFSNEKYFFIWTLEYITDHYRLNFKVYNEMSILTFEGTYDYPVGDTLQDITSKFISFNLHDVSTLTDLFNVEFKYSKDLPNIDNKNYFIIENRFYYEISHDDEFNLKNINVILASNNENILDNIMTYILNQLKAVHVYYREPIVIPLILDYTNNKIFAKEYKLKILDNIDLSLKIENVLDFSAINYGLLKFKIENKELKIYNLQDNLLFSYTLSLDNTTHEESFLTPYGEFSIEYKLSDKYSNYTPNNPLMFVDYSVIAYELTKLYISLPTNTEFKYCYIHNYGISREKYNVITKYLEDHTSVNSKLKIINFRPIWVDIKKEYISPETTEEEFIEIYQYIKNKIYNYSGDILKFSFKELYNDIIKLYGKFISRFDFTLYSPRGIRIDFSLSIPDGDDTIIWSKVVDILRDKVERLNIHSLDFMFPSEEDILQPDIYTLRINNENTH